MTTDIGNLKRKRTRERTTVTKLCTAVDDFTDETNVDEFILHHDRLQETLDKLTALDNEIHDQLTDAEYEADIVSCDQYIDNAKRGIYKCKKRIDETLVTSTASLKLQQPPPPPPTTPPPVHNLKLPPVKLEPFRGDVQKWMRFWEQFESCIDQDPYLSTINKHVFLRGYLEDEPKLLVDGIPVTAATYEKTKNILKERYGDVNRIVQVHLDLLENIRPLVSASPEELNILYIECNRHVHALTALGKDVNAYGRILSAKILRAFPSALCQRWLLHAKHHNLSEANILELMKFIGNEVDTSLTAQKIRCDYSELMPTAAALHVRAAPRPSRPSKSYSKGDATNKPYCVFCDQKDHWAQDCFVVKNVTDRIQKLKTANRCFLCLNRGHNRLSCRKRRYVSCSKCKGDHHKSICHDNNPSRVEREDPPPVATAAKTSTVGRIDIVSPSFVYLQTARVWVTGPTGIRKLTRCVLDCGSQSSFVSDSLIDELQLNVINTQNLTVNSFENAAVLHPRRLVKVSVTSFWSHSSVQITAFESSHSFSAHPTTPNDLNIFGSARKLKLADPTDNSCDLPIQLLIGGDFYWKVVNDRSPLRLSDSIVLLSSKFGWILSGARSGVVSNMINVNYIYMDETPPDKDMRRFWDLETMGIDAKQPRCMSSSESATLEQFYASYQTQNGRRVVSLPKKGNFDALSSNQLVAKNRFHSLEKRLATDTCIREAYHDQMMGYISKGQVEPVLCNSSSTAHYLPHHIVKKRRCDTVKYRVVFDASSHEINCPSLNDCLEAGPNLVPDSVAILLRFRLWPIALTGDVVQAFLQLELHPDDRDLTRFFWYQVIGKDNTYSTTNEIGTYRFTRLPFGLTCSPFLLAATIKELTLTYKDQYPSVTRLLENNMYVDDFASGADNDDNAISLYYDLITLMKKISFPMSKWATNSQVLKDIWCAEGQEDFVYTKVLGVNWNTMSDYLYTENHLDIKDIIAVPVTKRQLLRATAAFYDPLGLFSPVSIVGKILFQETWCRGISWDELLPHDLGTQWNAWTSTLPCLADVHVPRYVGHMNENSEIHVFCDASERAYGAVLYLRHVVDDKFIVNLVCSKNRLSPVNRVTLPRLELLAALVGARLLHYFCKETGNAAERATLWTDSMVVLGWVQNNANLWKTFVCNRVTEIQNYTSPSQWKHCPGIDNPADHLSRGVTPSQLVTLKTWWHGPAWLSQHSDDFPSSTISTDLQLPEKKPVAVPVYVVVSGEPLINSSDFSSYWKLLRITAWVLRFVNCLLKRIKSSGELTATELHAARNFWIHSVQKDCFSAEINALQNNLPLPSDSSIARYNPFLDDDGFIRLGGRLQFADLSKNEKHPFLLDGKHHFTELLICSTHVRLHHLGTRIVLSELRSEFWITRARQAIKRVIYRCLPCKIAKGHFAQQIEAPLPADRVTPQKVFAITGIDFAGPVFIKTEAAMQKSYIVLFTCASIRAIHLELCTNMSTDCFLLAFERFVGRRGLPHTVYTDNARSFHAANDSLQELWITLTASRTHSYFAEHGITWKFIAPRAAWWGGWWERMIGTAKRCLRKVLGKSRVSAENFSTLLVSIEAAINSRPLVPDEEGLEALTPAHFLVGDKLTTLPSGLEPNPNVNLTKEFKIQNQITDEFWKRWSKEYLLTLKNFHEVRQPKGLLAKLKIGDIVLVQEDSRPRQMWSRARIEDLLEGRDGRVRTVLLHTPEGKRITRPVQLVIPLEIDQGGEDVAQFNLK